MSHITVTPADEDEVIIAGGGPAETPEAAAAAAAGDSQPASPAGQERDVAEAAADGPVRTRGKAGVPGPASRDRYRESTLDDLEPQPMPLAQRIVVIAAVVCIIGALVYYFVAMR